MALGAFPSIPGLDDTVAPNPLVTAVPYADTLVFENSPLPGHWILQAAPREFVWNQQVGYGLEGANMLPNYTPPAHIKFLGRLWRSADFITWRLIEATLLQRAAFTIPGVPGGLVPSKPFSVYHPTLHARGITRAVLKSIDGPIQQEGGMWHINLELREFRTLRPNVQKPQDIPSATAPTPSAQTAEQVEIAQLRGERQAVLAQVLANP